MQKQKFVSAREIKQNTVTSLAEKIKKAKSLAFADYRGLTVNQISQIRSKVKEAGGEVQITKNSLIKRALEVNKYLRVDAKNLEGPTATIFAYDDEIAPIKAIAESAKVTGLPAFKFGFFGKDLLDVAGVAQLATIPSKPELQAKIVSAISSPLYGVVSVLSANIRNLVSVIDQAAKKQA